MKIEDVVNEIKLELSGGVLELEIEDATIKMLIQKALRELTRYWNETALITIPYASCIDFKNTPLAEANSIIKCYRTVGVGDGQTANGQKIMDPAYLQMWTIFSNGNIQYSLQDYIMNYASWSTLGQIRNTMSTDMSFKVDVQNKKLYINGYSMGAGDMVTIEFIPKLNHVEDIKTDYWQDILIRLSTDYVKIALGRIRTRFTQNNALWGQDGQAMLDEGNNDIKELRELLRQNSDYVYPID